MMATRCRALWLVCLLALSPWGSLVVLVAAHAPGGEQHAAVVAHDASNHGIDAGALAATATDRDCLFCQSVSTLRPGLGSRATRLLPPGDSDAARHGSQRHRLPSAARQAVPARGPPVRF